MTARQAARGNGNEAGKARAAYGDAVGKGQHAGAWGTEWLPPPLPPSQTGTAAEATSGAGGSDDARAPGPAQGAG
jgi:hypothetical protein